MKCLLKLSCLIVLLIISIPAHAKKPPLSFSGYARARTIFLKDTDLGSTNANHTDGQSLSVLGKLTWRATKKLRFQTEAVATANYGTQGNSDGFFNEAADKDFIELRKLWVEYKRPAGIRPLRLAAGRMRISEERGIWWRRSFDAAMIRYKTDKLKGFIAAGENLGPHNTAKTDFEQDEEKIARIFSEISYQWNPKQFIEGRMHLQNDHSGLEPIGATIDTYNRDTEDENLFWAGIRLNGTTPTPLPITGIKYSAELMMVTGSINTLTTIAGAPGTRIVTGANRNNVMGWGFDGTMDIPLSITPDFTPSLLLGYAFGSGNDSGSTDTAFRQSDLANNYSKPGRSSSSSMNRHGSVFRPELQNMQIFTVASSTKILKASDITLSYKHYRRNNLSAIGQNGIDAPLAATGKTLGNGADIFMNIKIAKELNIRTPYLRAVNFRASVGGFKVGDAYGSREGNIALRSLFDVTVKF